MALDFEWDEYKNELNIKKHKISFAEVVAIFKNSVVTFTDDRYDYGETRKVSYGILIGIGIFTVVYTERNNKYRIISARKAKLKERKLYYDYLAKKS